MARVDGELGYVPQGGVVSPADNWSLFRCGSTSVPGEEAFFIASVYLAHLVKHVLGSSSRSRKVAVLHIRAVPLTAVDILGRILRKHASDLWIIPFPNAASWIRFY